MKGVVTHDRLLAVVEALAGFPVPWYVSGGWALDLYAGQISRLHEDLEIGIARCHQHHIQSYLADRPLFKAVEHAWVPWEQGETLSLPVFQVLVGPQGPGEFEFMLNETSDGRWRYRRDEAISGPEEELIVRSPAGIPVLAPEIQLLYKSSRRRRPKDEADFACILPQLEPKRRARLAALLTQSDPAHPWLRILDAWATA